MVSLVDAIQRAFDAPETSLGTIERNTEMKVVFLMLWELGWDPVLEIAGCFQIRRESFEPASRSALAVDVALRDNLGLCAIGEIKQWFDDDWPKGRSQLLRYQSSLKVPRAFLTCGWKWTVFADGEPRTFENRRDAAALIGDLKDVLGAGAINRTPRPEALWKYGMCPNPRRMRKSGTQI